MAGPHNKETIVFLLLVSTRIVVIMAGPQCCEKAPAKEDYPSSGDVEEWGPLKVYVTGSSVSKKAVILISDIFGFDAPNLRKLADKVAAEGYFVVVPDYFYGDPFIPRDPSNPFATFPDWIKNHGPDKAVVDTKTAIEALKNKGLSVIGAGGFCWGAKVVVELLKGDDIKAGVLLHPSFVKEEDIKEVKAPLAILGAEIDKTSPPELINKFEEILSARPEIDSFVTIYPGVAHGWTVRYDTNDETACKRAVEAHEKMLEWFNKHLMA